MLISKQKKTPPRLRRSPLTLIKTARREPPTLSSFKVVRLVLLYPSRIIKPVKRQWSTHHRKKLLVLIWTRIYKAATPLIANNSEKKTQFRNSRSPGRAYQKFPHLVSTSWKTFLSRAEQGKTQPKSKPTTQVQTPCSTLMVSQTYRDATEGVSEPPLTNKFN